MIDHRTVGEAVCPRSVCEDFVANQFAKIFVFVKNAHKSLIVWNVLMKFCSFGIEATYECCFLLSFVFHRTRFFFFSKLPCICFFVLCKKQCRGKAVTNVPRIYGPDPVAVIHRAIKYI